MSEVVSITSQGQISIPAKFRAKLGLNKYKKALVSEDGERLIVEPVKDLLSLGGSLKTSKKATSRKIRQDFEEYMAKEAIK